MNKETTNRAPDTSPPAEVLREALENAGFTVSGLPNDLTREQVAELAEELLRQLDSQV